MLNFSRAVSWFTGPQIKACPEQFMADFASATQPVAVKGKSRLLLTPNGGRVLINLADNTDIMPKRRSHKFIQSLVAETPGQGDGEYAMSLLTTWADKAGMNLGIFVTPIAHKAMEHEALIKWVEKHHFEEYGDPPALFWREPRR